MPVRMAGLRKGPRAPSTRSLGSFVDIQSASSSDFEPVDLEDMESADESEGRATAVNQGAGALSSLTGFEVTKCMRQIFRKSKMFLLRGNDSARVRVT